MTKVPNQMLLSQNDASLPVAGDNLITNSSFQLHSALTGDFGAASSRVRPDGLQLVGPMPVSSFSVNNAQPTFMCSNTQGLKSGDLVRFPAGNGGLSGYALRLITVVDNVSFTAQLPYGKVSPPSSYAITAWPVGIVSSSNIVADGWSSSGSMTYWPDDWPANRCPGAIRTAGIKKGIATTWETFSQFLRPERLGDLRGTRVTFGAMIYMPYAGGTIQMYIGHSGGSVLSTPLSGVTAGYQFATVTADIDINTTFVEFGFGFTGAINSVAYIGRPTVKYGSAMRVTDLGQPRHEIIVARRHHNPPSMIPLVITFPPTEIAPGAGLYGYYGLDLEALGFGQVHNSVSKVNAKIETTCPAVGTIVFVCAMDGEISASVDLVFGPQTRTIVANQEVDTSMTWLPLRKGPSNYGSPPGCFAIVGIPASGVIRTLTFDFDDVMA